MKYISPKDVVSPRVHWHLFEVILDGGERGASYALGSWDGERSVGFRWNGSSDAPIGNPQSRGLPTWTILDPALHEAIVGLVASDKRAIVKAYLGLK
jgi:hypothetical protein